MAIIKAVSSRASIGNAVNYVTKGEKTEVKLVSGIDCNPQTAIEEMKATKELWNKTEGRQYAHYVHSFPPNEAITPEKAHELAKELCKERFKGHEVLIATHQDTDHIHSHIIVNSVNYQDGHKYQQSQKDLYAMKEHCNELSRANGLSVPEKGEGLTSYNQKKYKAMEKSITGNYKSYVVDCYKAVAVTKNDAVSREDFIEKMKSKGYEVNWSDNRKNITFTDQQGKKVRNSNLEKTFKEPFGKEDLERGFEINAERADTKRRARKQLSGLDEADRGTEIGDFQATIGKAGNAINAEKARREAERAEQIRRAEQAQREQQQKALERSTRSQGFER